MGYARYGATLGGPRQRLGEAQLSTLQLVPLGMVVVVEPLLRMVVTLVVTLVVGL